MHGAAHAENARCFLNLVLVCNSDPPPLKVGIFFDFSERQFSAKLILKSEEKNRYSICFAGTPQQSR